MTREIKFRGKRIDNGEWIIGSLVIDSDKKSASIFGDGFRSHVEIESVGQFTGIIDKNGVEIYEGGIVTCWDDSAKEPSWGFDKIHTGVIEYIPNCFCLKIPGKLVYDTPCVKSWDQPVCLDFWINAENIEVIGNIYENLHLLNGGTIA